MSNTNTTNSNKKTQHNSSTIHWKQLTKKKKSKLSSVLSAVKGRSYNDYLNYFEKKSDFKVASHIRELVQLINYWCGCKSKINQVLVNYQSLSPATIMEFLKKDTIFIDNSSSIQKFIMNLIADKFLNEQEFICQLEDVEEVSLGDFVNILKIDPLNSNQYLIPAIGQVVNEQPFQVRIETTNHVHYQTQYETKKVIVIDKDLVAKLENYSSTQSNLSNMLPNNRVTITSSSIIPSNKERNYVHSSTDKRNRDDVEVSDESDSELSDNSSNESDNSSDSDDNVKRRKYSKSIQSKSKECSISNELSYGKKTSNQASFLSYEEYFKVCEVNGETMYYIVPDKVQKVIESLKKEKVFSAFTQAITNCQNEFLSLTENYPHMFTRCDYFTTINGKEYCIPKSIIEKAFPNPKSSQTTALNVLSKDLFKHNQPTQLTRDERAVCRNFFRDILKADPENVRKIINSTNKRDSQ